MTASAEFEGSASMPRRYVTASEGCVETPRNAVPRGGTTALMISVPTGVLHAVVANESAAACGRSVMSLYVWEELPWGCPVQIGRADVCAGCRAMVTP
jgi:hypothetical protein